MRKTTLAGLVTFLSLITLSISSVSATVTLSVGNNSASPVNNLLLNFSWTNSSVIYDTPDVGYNSTGNITFNLPSGIVYISDSGQTNITSGISNISLSSSSLVIFGNETVNDTSDVDGWIAFNISSGASGLYTIIANETYRINSTSDYVFSNTFELSIVNGTITLTNSTFSNFTYNGISMVMNFTGTPSTAIGGSVTDNITFNLYLNDVLYSTNYTCSATCSDNDVGIISYTNATADSYVFVFNTSGTNNYTATSFTSSLNISQAIPILKTFIDNSPVNTTSTYLTNDGTSTTFSGTVALGNSTVVPEPTFNMYIMNITQSSPAVYLMSPGNPAANSSTLGSATYRVIYNTSGNTNYTSVSNGTLYVIVSKGTLILNLTGSNVRLPMNVTILPIVSSTDGLTDVNFSFWRDSTLFSSALGSTPTADTSTISAGRYVYKLNTTGTSFANWTVNATGVSITIDVLEEGGGSDGSGGGPAPIPTTTTTLFVTTTTATTLAIPSSLEEIVSSPWWDQTTLGVLNWQLVAISVGIIGVAGFLWWQGVLRDIFDEITK